ncbi:hypothetical protein CLOM_g17244 [Closterium sp. NIES-68]|nr:hypothetical protein CLOM_g17244 [Closterium sp. NIES-68]GJP79306.1 hypothetical protein CLOP_g9551 [Closterium sp. NIES-67]
MALTILSSSWFSFHCRFRSLPPGPSSWLILGNLPDLDILPYRSLARLADRYGPILTVWFGSKPAVVVSSPKLAEEVLKTKDKLCATRPLTRTVALLTNNGRFMATLPCDDDWRKQRRLAMLHLLSARNMKANLGVRELEIRDMLDTIATDAAAATAAADLLKTGMNGGSSIEAAGLEVRRYLNLAALNNILRLTVGKHFSYEAVRHTASAATCSSTSTTTSSGGRALDAAMEIAWEGRIAAIRSEKRGNSGGASTAEGPSTSGLVEDEAEGEKVIAIIEEAFSVGGAFNIADYIPGVRFLDPQRVYTRVQRLAPQLHGFMRACIEERRQLITRRKATGSGEKGAADDWVFMDALLEREGEGDDAVTAEEMMMLGIEIIMAGTATTSKTVEWALAELAQRPDMLARLQAEVDAARATSVSLKTQEQEVGSGNSDPTVSLPVQDMPYLQAVLKETFRHHPVGPFLVRQVTGGNVTLGGYTIPPGTMILINTWALGHDPTVWINPHEFNPSRFLDPAAPDLTGKSFSLLPFGSGRRGCAGMNLGLDLSARMLAGFVRQFDFELPGDVRAAGGVDMGEEFGLAMSMAKPLRIVCRERKGVF